MLTVIETYFILFMLYGFTGWCWESLLYTVKKRRFVNRGFLYGPYCPIYGLGAILDILVMGSFQNPLFLFFAGAILACSLEYLTSWGMERLFNARWWDYSNRKFNLNGRVCLLGAIVFGVFSVLLLKIIHPFVLSYMKRIPHEVMHYVAAILFMLIFTDVIYTVTSVLKFNEKLKELSSELAEIRAVTIDAANRYTETIISNITENEAFERINEVYERFYRKINAQARRILRVFPEFKSFNNDRAVQGLKRVIKKMKDKKLKR